MFSISKNKKIMDNILDPKAYEGKNILQKYFCENGISIGHSKSGELNAAHRKAIIDLTCEFPNPLFFEAGESFINLTHIVLGQDEQELDRLVKGNAVYDKTIERIVDPSTVSIHSDILIGGQAVRYLLDKAKEKTFIKVAEEYLTKQVNKGKHPDTWNNVYWDPDEMVMRLEGDFQEEYAENFRKSLVQNPNQPVISLIKATENLYDVFLIDKLSTLPPNLRMSIEDRRSPIDIMYDDLVRAINVFSKDIKTLSNLNIYLSSYRNVYDKLHSIICKSHKELNRSSIKETISKKEGFIRSTILSTVVNNSTRSVITSAGLEADLGKVTIPQRAYDILSESLRSQGYDGPIYATHNRAPTLHLHSIQALEIRPGESHSIKNHPVLNPGYNADNDGDTMADTVPSLLKSLEEISVVMNPTCNPFKAGTGEVILEPQQDNVYGMYILTDYEGLVIPPKGVTKPKYKNIEALLNDFKSLSAHVSDFTSIDGVSLTVGYHIFRHIFGVSVFNEILSSFNNKYIQHTKKSIDTIFNIVYDLENKNEINEILNRFSKYTYIAATNYPPTLDVNRQIKFPNIKEIVDNEYKRLYKDYSLGLITKESFNHKISNIYNSTIKNTIKEVLPSIQGGFRHMSKSGSKGNDSNLEQIFIMKGLINTEDGDAYIIKNSFLSGLSSMEHAIVGIATRLSLVEKSQKPADTGYLQRQFVHTTQDLIIKSEDCGATSGIKITKHDIVRFNEMKNNTSESDHLKSVKNYLIGRYLINNVFIDDDLADKLSEDIILNNKEVEIRSPLTCLDPCCVKCYGVEWSTKKPPIIGRHVGIIAAQSSSELATQLTMKSFQNGGVAGASNIGSDFDMVKAIANCRNITPEMFITHKGKICPDFVADKSGYVIYSKVRKGIIVGIIPYDWIDEGRDSQEQLDLLSWILKEPGKDFEIYGPLPIDPIFLKKEVIKGEGIMKTQGLMTIKDIIRHGGLLKAQQYVAHSIYSIYSTSSGLKPIHTEILALGMTRYVGIGKDNYGIQKSARDKKEIMENEDQWVPKIVSTDVAPSCTHNWLSTMSFDRMTNNLIGAVLYQLEDDHKSLYSRIITGQPPLVGSYYNKNYVEEHKRRWHEKKWLK